VLGRQLATVVLTFWVGALWTMGLLIAPALFRVLPERVLAGAVAGRLFTTVAYAGLACGAVLFAQALVRPGRGALGRPLYLIVLGMIALTAIGEFGLQPVLADLKGQAAPLDVMQSPFRDRFSAWHAAASGLYLLNCALGLVAVVLHDRAGRTTR
jgi:hypothetical protein